MKKYMYVLSYALLLGIFGCGMEQVEEGTRGIKKTWGKVEKDALLPGFYFYDPVSSTILEMDVKEHKHEGVSDAFTKDMQTVKVGYVLTAYPDPMLIQKIYSQFGIDWEAKIIAPVILRSIKDVVGKVVADDLVYKREAAQASAFDEVRLSLKERGVVSTRLDFVNLDFNDEYEKAIEAKVVAFQRAQEAKNKTIQIKEEAEQRVISATAEAQSMKIKADALVKNPALIQYEYVQKWDGKTPLVTGGSGMLLSLPNDMLRRSDSNE